MRPIILSFLISLSLSATAQTIPNGDFEQWVPTALFSLDPAEWQTGNTQLSTPVYPDLDACLNDTAMTVEAVPISLGKYGNANVTFAIGAIPPQLDFCARWNTTPTGAVNVSVSFYNGAILAYSAHWNQSGVQEDWTSISLPLEQIEPVITDARVEVSAFVGDFAEGDALITVDDIHFGSPEAVENPQIIEYGLSPNPGRDFLKVSGDLPMGARYQIMDQRARIVLHGQLDDSQLDIRSLSPGSYMVHWMEAERLIGSSRFIKR